MHTPTYEPIFLSLSVFLLFHLKTAENSRMVVERKKEITYKGL